MTKVRSRISVGSSGNPALRCADCEDIINDNILGTSVDVLEMMAQEHRCTEAEYLSYVTAKAEYELGWSKGKDGQ